MKQTLLAITLLALATTETREATTAHGTVEYEVVECASCGNTTAKEEAQRFVIANAMTENARGSYKVHGPTAKGWACQYCADGPASFPTNTASRVPSIPSISGLIGKIIDHTIIRPPKNAANTIAEAHDLDRHDREAITFLFTITWLITAFVVLMSVGIAL